MTEKEIKEYNIFDEALEFVGGGIVDVESRHAHFKPQWNDEVTEESMRKHIQFIHDSLLSTAIGTSAIATEQGKGSESVTWVGETDLSGLSLQAQCTYSPDNEENTLNTQLSIHHQFDSETRELADEFLSLDRVRCKKLFDVP